METLGNPAVPVNTNYSSEEEREIFRIAVAHMNMHVFVYDIKRKKICFLGCDTPPFGVLCGSEYSVEEVIASGILDSENAAIFRKLFADICDGAQSTSAVLRTISGTRTSWSHLLLLSYYNAAGAPFRTIGTIQDVSARIETEQRYSIEKQYRTAMMADSRRVYEINVSRDRFIKLESISDSTDYGDWNLYTESMANLCKTKVFQEDWETFLKIATRENLLEGFRNGITEFYCEYRALGDDGQPYWSSSATHLLTDPLTGDIKGFIYVKDIDKQKRREMELYQQAELDPLTGIYNRRTTERLITQILLASGSEHLHALLCIDIDEFKHVNDTYGHAKGDYLLQQMALVIGSTLRSVDIFARMGGDEFIVFLNHCATPAHATEVARRLCQEVRDICVDEATDFHATISVGIALFPQHGSTFAELYQNADHSMYEVKQHGKNNVAVFEGTAKQGG